MSVNVRAPVIEDDSYGLFDLPNHTGTPERRLMLAVIERAILDFVGNDERETETAAQWLFGDLDKTECTEFSFPWICRELDLDVNRIASKISQMPKRGSRRVAPWYFLRASN